jgi:AbrB family looped-hinge helix DNA binding protein
MAKVTSKRQVTIPKAIADQYGIREGDTLEFVPAGDVIRMVPARVTTSERSAAERLELFDAATERQRMREDRREPVAEGPTGRGWTRDELYRRGSTD